MPVERLLVNDEPLTLESGEDAYRRVLQRKLRERGCRDDDIDAAVGRVLAAPVGVDLSDGGVG